MLPAVAVDLREPLYSYLLRRLACRIHVGNIHIGGLLAVCFDSAPSLKIVIDSMGLPFERGFNNSEDEKKDF